MLESTLVTGDCLRRSEILCAYCVHTWREQISGLFRQEPGTALPLSTYIDARGRRQRWTPCGLILSLKIRALQYSTPKLNLARVRVSALALARSITISAQCH